MLPLLSFVPNVRNTKSISQERSLFWRVGTSPTHLQGAALFLFSGIIVGAQLYSYRSIAGALEETGGGNSSHCSLFHPTLSQAFLIILVCLSAITPPVKWETLQKFKNKSKNTSRVQLRKKKQQTPISKWENKVKTSCPMSHKYINSSQKLFAAALSVGFTDVGRAGRWWRCASSFVAAARNAAVLPLQEVPLPLDTLFLGNQWNDIRAMGTSGEERSVRGEKGEARQWEESAFYDQPAWPQDLNPQLRKPPCCRLFPPCEGFFFVQDLLS